MEFPEAVCLRPAAVSPDADAIAHAHATAGELRTHGRHSPGVANPAAQHLRPARRAGYVPDVVRGSRRPRRANEYPLTSIAPPGADRERAHPARRPSVGAAGENVRS